MNSKIPIAILAVLIAAACKGNDSKTQAALNETAQDTSLARDLALAGADTLLYSEAADVAMTEDTTTRVVDRGEPVNRPAVPTSRPAPPPVSPVSQGQPATPPIASSGNACASPTAADQRRCLMQYLARSDASLNRTYQNVIRTLGRAEEERLRQAQRAWLVFRDTECRRKTRSSEGALWAPVRAKCLGEYSAARERELAAKLQ